MVKNFTGDRDETHSLVYFSLKTETRPRLSSFTGVWEIITLPTGKLRNLNGKSFTFLPGKGFPALFETFTILGSALIKKT